MGRIELRRESQKPHRSKHRNDGAPEIQNRSKPGPPALGHLPRYGQRHLHFITSSCYRRLPLFALLRRKNLFVQILGEVRDRYGFALGGWQRLPQIFFS